MRPSIRRKLEALVERREEVGRLLGDPAVAADPARFRDLSREYAQLEPVALALAAHDAALRELAAARALGDDGDPELAALAAEEVARLTDAVAAAERRLEAELVPRDPRDELGLFLEVRAGTGGDEAALFAGDLMRMYLRYAESRGWRATLLEASPGEHGGYKKAVARIEGPGAWSRLRFEAGTHRVQRVPETEAQGRIHTSACTVAVLPEAPEAEEVAINPADLRIDTFRSSGAGGQHVNKTESAIRITHLPSGIVVESQSERSQHANRDHAMRRLRAELAERRRAEQVESTAESRRQQVGSGDRSERIRTYNFPQGRVTDHRINLTLYALDRVLEGELDPLVEPLLREHQAEQLRRLTEAA
jgi:peptide chain release factor 1